MAGTAERISKCVCVCVCVGGGAGGGGLKTYAEARVCRGVWGHPPPPPKKILKSRGSEIVFTAFSARYFLK